ncbi:hypothetical protein SPHINGOR109_10433 [Sphingorhabdus sp. 109]|nr:hypothetical protein SPHINGOR109_10433 [Sphingorhabdus sp. 109]
MFATLARSDSSLAKSLAYFPARNRLNGGVTSVYKELAAYKRANRRRTIDSQNTCSETISKGVAGHSQI